jgi:hypothetical protein
MTGGDEYKFETMMAELKKVHAFLKYKSYLRDAADLEHIMWSLKDKRKEFEEFV